MVASRTVISVGRAVGYGMFEPFHSIALLHVPHTRGHLSQRQSKVAVCLQEVVRHGTKLDRSSPAAYMTGNLIGV